MRYSQAVGLQLLALCLLGSPSVQAAPPSQATGNRSQQKWALLVGVDDYAELTTLRYAGNDQRALAERLIAAGFPADQVFLLHDKATQNKYRPFRENIEKQLNLVLTMVEHDDLVIVGFSGHGIQVEGKSYLCPSDARLDALPGTLISLDSVYERLSKCKAALKLLLVDACRNDAVPAGRRSMGSARGIGEFAEAKERPPEGILLLSSCGAGQVSLEDEQFGHGVFMHYLLEGLDGKAAGPSGNVTLAGLYDYASLETKKYVARKFNEYQTPALRGDINGPFEICSSLPQRANDESGFVDLFDGKTLAGWWGDTEYYSAENGMLVSDFGPIPHAQKSGHLYSAKQYGDFVLRLNYKLSSAANSGVLIRAAKCEQPSQDGFEVQILDDADEENQKLNLQPWMLNGSLTRVAAATNGAPRPPGEWNSMEIVCRGRKIQVTLNGARIVDVDLTGMGTIDLAGKVHPGMARNDGYVGFNGLGSRGRVEFRNIRIKELK